MLSALGAKQFWQEPHVQENSQVLQFYGKIDDQVGKVITEMMTVANGPLSCLLCSNAFGMGIDVKILSLSYTGEPANL